MAAQKELDRPLWVVSTRWWMAASAKRSFTDRLPATKSTRGRSHHDPKATVVSAGSGRSTP